MSTMSKKVSAFQVYSDDQLTQRHSRSYRALAPRPPQQPSKYESPPPRSTRVNSADWRDEVKVDSRGPSRNSPSPDMRRDRGYDYDVRRDDASGSRYVEDLRQTDVRDRQSAQGRYRGEDQYDDDRWVSKDRQNDYADDRDRTSLVRKDDYLPERDVQRNIPSKGVRTGTQLSDSDEECLHESLRRKKQDADRYSDNERDRRWSTDDDDYNTYKQPRKRALSPSPYRSPSPPPAKNWGEGRQVSPEQRQYSRVYSDEDSKRGRLASPPIKKKKLKAGKKNGKTKVKKQKGGLLRPAVQLPSLMDLKIPSSVKKQVELTASTDTLPRFGEKRSDFKFGQRDNGRTVSRSESDDRRHNDTGRTRSRNYTNNQDRHRPSASSYRQSDLDRRGPRSRRDSYNSRHSPDYDRRRYRHSDDNYDGGRDRQRRRSYSKDGRSHGDTKRKRQSSGDRRDWSRSGNRTSQRDRSPDFSNHSDSDQDSERGGRRSWRDEKRDRQQKKKNGDQDKDHKGDKKDKGKQEDKNPKKSVSSKKSQHDSNARKSEPPNWHMMACKDGVAVLLMHPYKVCVRGRVKLQVMAGEISIMGYTMGVKGSRTYDLYSPSTSCLLTISSSSVEKEKKVLRKALQTLDIEEKSVKDFMTGAIILWAKKLPFPAADYICTLPLFTQLFRTSFDRAAPQTAPSASTELHDRVGAVFLPLDQSVTNHIKVSENFDDALKKWTASVKATKIGPIGLVCGGQNSGKSTFARFMINSALIYASRVCYLDCDVGQTEFSPPGSIALTTITKPIFGPPFCHVKTPDSMCFYGMMNPAEGPTRYVQCVDYVLSDYLNMDHPPPLIVNTLGWNEGLGLKLLADIVDLVTPDLVVQLNLATETLNLPPLTPSFLSRHSGWLHNLEPVEEEEEEEDGEKKKKHEHVTVQSLVTSRNDPTGVRSPKNFRDLILLAHLMQGLRPSVTLTCAVPYVVPWWKFAVHVCHCHVPQRLLIDSLNASIVALCAADLSKARRVSLDMPLVFDETPICQCLGYGLVRAVDHKAGTLYLVTSIPSDRLVQVNTLMRGSINIPDPLLLKQGHTQDVPFIDALEPAMALAPVRPRARMPRRN